MKNPNPASKPGQSIASSITLDAQNGTVEINGIQFPYYVASEAIDVTLAPAGGLSVVRLPILVDGPINYTPKTRENPTDD